jgi:hypothetical protein
MAKTELNIAFVENNQKCDQIAFIDLSVYNSDIPVKTPIVTILYPDFTIPISLGYTPRSTNIVETTCIDGLYTFEISVCPNDMLKKTFYYFQLCNWYKWLSTELCKYSGNKTKINELIDLYKYSLAIKEVSNSEPKKAIIMFNYLKSKIC